MTGPNPILEGLERDWQRMRHRVEHPFRTDREAPVGTNPGIAIPTPAQQPVNLAAATAAAAPRGTRMSLIIDAENGYAAVKAEVAKLEASLPAALGVAKQLEGNPLVQVALKAAEHAAAGILPPEAVAYLAGNFMHDLEAMAAWFMQGQQPQATGQQPVRAAGAPAQ